jgi:mRNA interferase MazF
MTYEFGEVVLVPFPFTNQSTQKKRPAIVISSSEYNATRPDLILIAFSRGGEPDSIRWEPP